MGRKKINNVYGHFEVDKIKLKSKCKICNKELNSISGSNLMKHLKTHKTIYEEVEALNNLQKDSNKLSANSELLTRECMNLVSVHGRPLALLDDEAFQKILSLVPDCNSKVSSRSVRKDIIETAATLRDNLAKELHNKLICIKIDIASLSLRSFMGINAQYIQEGVIVLRNLAMIELLDRHTSEHLKDQILYVLQRFRISLDNIYSLTTDNGANMLKMGKLLNAAVEDTTSNTSIEITQNWQADRQTLDAPNSQDVERPEYLFVDSDSESDCDYDADTAFDTNREDELTETITSALSMHFHESTIQQRSIAVIRCAAHTLQLAVLEACNGAEIQPAIVEARKIAKELRTQKYSTFLSKSGKKQAFLDCPTRWNSTADMIERLLYLREVCDNSNDPCLQLTSTSWGILQDYLNSLLPAKVLSKNLQSEQLTIGDFYLEWLLCKIKLKSNNTALSNLLWNCMQTREQILFNNDAFLCAVLLDSRVNSTLSEDRRLDAKIKCLESYRHLQILSNDKENTLPSTSSSSVTQRTDSARLELEDFLSTKYIESQNDIEVILRRRDNMEMRLDLDDEITEFLKEPHLKSTENILKHWELNKQKYPRLYKLACVVLASPATQVSVERLFSSLKFVVSRLRFNLKRNLIEDIIFIRNNKLYNKL